MKDKSEVLLNAFTSGDATKKFADFLIPQAGDGVTMLTTKENLAAWLEEVYAPLLKKIVKVVKAQAELQTNIEQNVACSHRRRAC
jgi:hypothetical protein